MCLLLSTGEASWSTVVFFYALHQSCAAAFVCVCAWDAALPLLPGGARASLSSPLSLCSSPRRIAALNDWMQKGRQS